MTDPMSPVPAEELVAEVDHRRARRRLAATATAGVLVVASFGFAVSSLTAADGASSPEEAVEDLFDAIDQEDAIGVVEALEPVERDILRQVLDDAQAETERVGLTDEELDLGDVDGLDIDVEGLSMTTEQLEPGVVAVDLVSGTVRSAAAIDQLPAGSAIREAIDREREGSDPEDEGDDPGDELVELGGTRMVAVDTGDGWSVSVLGSIAENLRLDLDPAPAYPGPDDAIAPKGAPDPETAVRDAVVAAADLDVARLVELAPPAEGRVLHTYGTLLVDAAADSSTSAVEVSDLELSVEPLGDDRALVTADTVTVRYGDRYGTDELVYADGCTTSTYTSSEETLADLTEEERAESEGWDPTFEWCEDDTLATPFFGLYSVAVSPGSTAVVVERHDGAWYLAPTATLYRNTFGVLEGLDADEMRRVARSWLGEWWYAAEPELWEACGVDAPDLDATRAEGEEAYDRCLDALPEDYDGPWGPFGGWYGGGPHLDGGDWDEWEDAELTAEDECYGYAADGEFVERTDEEIEACLQGLVDQGLLSADVVAAFRCEHVWFDLPELTDEQWESMTDEELDEYYAEADAAYEACLAENGGGTEAGESETLTEEEGPDDDPAASEVIPPLPEDATPTVTLPPDAGD